VADSSISTMMHGVRGFFRFAHIDGMIPARPATYARFPKMHHGALAYLLRINALRAAAVRIEDYRETLRGHRVLHLVGQGSKPATMPLTVLVLRALKPAGASGAKDRSLRRADTRAMVSC